MLAVMALMAPLSSGIGSAPAERLTGITASEASLSPLVSTFRDLGPAPASDAFDILVALKLRHAEELQSIAILSAAHRGPFLTPEEMHVRFGPAPSMDARVEAWLEEAGFTGVHASPDGMLVAATGSNAAILRGFGTTIHLVELGSHLHHAPLNPPVLPADIASATIGILGLSDTDVMMPGWTTDSQSPSTEIAGECCGWSPADRATFYNETQVETGRNQTVVIAGAFTWSDADLATYDNEFDLPPLAPGSRQVCTGGTFSIGCTHSSMSLEVTLDLDMLHGTAPNATVINYAAADTSPVSFTTMMDQIVTDNVGQVVTESWGSCEATTTPSVIIADENILLTAAAEGQTWFAASGDWGKDCPASDVPSVLYPASSAYVVGVGGTVPHCDPPLSSTNTRCIGYGSEEAWKWSGGGVSMLIPRPAWQTGCGAPIEPVTRTVPDVALEAEPVNYVAFQGGWLKVGGTSDAAPQWAAIFAGLLEHRGSERLGLAAPRLYGLCGTNLYHDIGSGAILSEAAALNSPAYGAKTGYDLATGLGSFDAGRLRDQY